MKRFTTLIIFALLSIQVFAAAAVYNGEDYTLNVTYNDVIVPGDAVFVKMEFQYSKNHKKTKEEPKKNAVLQLYTNKKLTDKSVFYSISKTTQKKNAPSEFLAGIPISAWATDGEYSLKVIFSNGDDTKEFALPATFKNREFIHETIPLDEKNTAIKTDNTPERAAQIAKLNAILETVMPNDVYQLKKFTSPTTSTRYTSHFGDRRLYTYTNGKSSTNLHYGNDYGIPTGSEVRSCADGRVVMAENRISTGWSIVIEHLPGLYSLYYHLDSMNVKEGDMVKMGDLIGKSGSTGLATGPHLHWEMRLNMCAVRPEFFLEDFAFAEGN